MINHATTKAYSKVLSNLVQTLFFLFFLAIHTCEIILFLTRVVNCNGSNDKPEECHYWLITGYLGGTWVELGGGVRWGLSWCF